MQINILDFILTMSIAGVAIGALLGCYAIMSACIWVWEKVTGNCFEDSFKNCLPWLDDKES